MNARAVAHFQAQQGTLLADAYERAWRHGVASYEPDQDPARPADDTHAGAAAGAAAVLLARRRQRYRQPAAPDPTRRERALAPATASLDKMAAELRELVATPEHVQAAEAAAQSGAIEAGDVQPYADGLAVEDWLDANAWRLNAGESVAWAGEQAGYSEAADSDGQLLEWLPESDDHVCADCEGLGALPPMPLDQWPTTPGSGDTECSVGCRCVLQVSVDQELPAGELPALSDDEQALVSRIAEGRAGRELPAGP